MSYTDEEKLHLFLDELGVPRAKRRALLAAFKRETLFDLLRSRSPALSPYLGDRAADLGRVREGFAALLQGLRERGITAVTLDSPGYPELLRQTADPPFVLYCIGDCSLLRAKSVAVVGRRACRRKFLDLTERFAGELAAAGLVVVSGLAEGCDAAAHRGALQTGKTVAVLAGGSDHVYPQSNLELYREICRSGLAVSESPPGRTAMRHDFLQRNRIVAGLALGTLVTCAAERSGTLSTANETLAAGRELFVLPGDVDSEDSQGTNRLIREAQGALVTRPEDILETLGVAPAERTPRRAEIPRLDEDSPQKAVLDVLSEEELHINEIAEKLGSDFARLAPLLSVMEIEGRIERLPSNRYRRKR